MIEAVVIEAVFFDVDDTLVDYDRAARAGFHEVFGADADFALWLVASDPHFARYGRGEVGFQQMREERTADFLASAGRVVDRATSDEIEARRFALVGRSYELFDDVLPCLQALRDRRVRLGLITNNEPVHQRGKLAQVGLSDGFDVVVISGEVGLAKPDPAIFEYACSAVGVAPHQALHVGDRLDLDALAAAAAGLTGVWLDRRGVHDGSPLDVPVISGLGDVGPLLG